MSCNAAPSVKNAILTSHFNTSWVRAAIWCTESTADNVVFTLGFNSETKAAYFHIYYQVFQRLKKKLDLNCWNLKTEEFTWCSTGSALLLSWQKSTYAAGFDYSTRAAECINYVGKKESTGPLMIFVMQIIPRFIHLSRFSCTFNFKKISKIKPF